eukprot:2423570-Rhodomonas_salina.1
MLCLRRDDHEVVPGTTIALPKSRFVRQIDKKEVTDHAEPNGKGSFLLSESKSRHDVDKT